MFSAWDTGRWVAVATRRSMRATTSSDPLARKVPEEVRTCGQGSQRLIKRSTGLGSMQADVGHVMRRGAEAGGAGAIRAGQPSS